MDAGLSRHDDTGGQPDLVDCRGRERVPQDIVGTKTSHERCECERGSAWTAQILTFWLFHLFQYLNQLNKQLDQVVQLMGKSTLTNNDRKKFDTVLTIDVHTRDIIEGFVRDSIMDAMEFEWESQLRYSSTCVITIGDSAE